MRKLDDLMHGIKAIETNSVCWDEFNREGVIAPVTLGFHVASNPEDRYADYHIKADGEDKELMNHAIAMIKDKLAKQLNTTEEIVYFGSCDDGEVAFAEPARYSEEWLDETKEKLVNADENYKKKMHIAKFELLTISKLGSYLHITNCAMPMLLDEGRLNPKEYITEAMKATGSFITEVPYARDLTMLVAVECEATDFKWEISENDFNLGLIKINDMLDKVFNIADAIAAPFEGMGQLLN